MPPTLARVAVDPQHEVQIVYSRVHHGDNAPKFETFTFQENAGHYFYPASTVKLPVALFALEKIGEWRNKHGVQLDTPMITGKDQPWQTEALVDPTTDGGLPTAGNYVRKICLISDNDAFNRLFELVGTDQIQQRLREIGCTKTVIRHRLAVSRQPDHGRYANPVSFRDGERELLSIPGRKCGDLPSHGLPGIRGHGYIRDGVLFSEPKDFSGNNFFPLTDQQRLLRMLIYPSAFPEKNRLRLDEPERDCILNAMRQFPGESECPSYPKNKFPDGYAKFFLFAPDQESYRGLRSYGKSGMAYGYLTENARLIDEERQIEFFLSATIHTNANGIFNDNVYEYDNIGLPFLKALSKAIYDIEIERAGQN